MDNKKYNGWSNYETWNVAMHFNLGLRDFYIRNMNSFKGIRSYKGLIISLGLENSSTSDGVAYLNKKLNFKELNDMIKGCRKQSDC